MSVTINRGNELLYELWLISAVYAVYQVRIRLRRGPGGKNNFAGPWIAGIRFFFHTPMAPAGSPRARGPEALPYWPPL